MTNSTAAIDEQINGLRHIIRENRIQFWLCASSLITGLGVEVALIVLAVILSPATPGEFDWGLAAFIFGVIFLFIGAGILEAAVKRRDTIAATRSALRRADEDRKTTAAGRGSTRLVVLNRYKNDLPEVVERFRLVAKRYRRTHNMIQLVTVAGSLIASVTIAVFGAEVLGRSVATVASAGVAVAAAYSGYFRYKEKSLSLQATADGIEQEHRAVQLGVGTYAGLSSVDALSTFAEKVEALRSNQQRQALELDQAVQVEYQPGPSYDLQ